MPHGRRVGYRLPSDNMAAGINLSIPHLELSIVWRLWVPLVSSVLLGLFTRWASHRYDTPRPPWGSSLGLLYLILLSSAWSCQFEVTDFLQPLLFYVPWIPTSRPYRGLRLVRVNPPPRTSIWLPGRGRQMPSASVRGLHPLCTTYPNGPSFGLRYFRPRMPMFVTFYGTRGLRNPCALAPQVPYGASLSSNSRIMN